MDAKPYDLVVIGSGPAGEKGAAQAAYFGKSVALIEAQPALGGACANTGTLPSKTLRETALFLSGFRNRELYGLQFTLKQQVNVRDFMARERYICDTERARTLLQDDLAARPKVKLSDVEAAQRQLAELAQELAKAGRLVLGQADEKYV